MRAHQRVPRDAAADVEPTARGGDLKEEIQIGNFREDLYHRLAVIKIHLPSLNDRKADIPELTKHFIYEISKDQGVKPKDITLKAQRMLQEYTWKGNVRELRNTIERLLILGDNEELNKYPCAA